MAAFQSQPRAGRTMMQQHQLRPSVGRNDHIRGMFQEFFQFRCGQLAAGRHEFTALLQQEALARLLHLLPETMHVEVETNGTIAPTPALEQRITQWNISPKLNHSGNPGEKSLRPEVLEHFAAMPQAWFKFVVQSEADWPAIAALGLPQQRIILMPCATTRAELETARPAVVDMCLRHRVRLGDRLHLTLWDDKKGV